MGQVGYGVLMDIIDDLTGLVSGFDTPLGIVLIVVAALVVIKAAKLVVKLAMIPVVIAGLYLWFGVNG